MIKMNERITASYARSMNIKYSLVQGLYWMIYCCTLSMASAVLAGKNYEPSKIGFIFAIVYLLGICIQQIVSVFVDKAEKINVIDVIIFLSVVMIFALYFSSRTTEEGVVTTLWFMVGGIAITVMQPFLNALNFYIEKTNIQMNFGIARGMGSFFFFIASLSVGRLMNYYSVNAAAIFGLVMTFVFSGIVISILIPIRQRRDIIDANTNRKIDSDKDDFSLSKVFSFVSRYKAFFVFLIGVIGFYYGHMVVNNFLFQIVVSVGGDESVNGMALAVQAVVELPCMFLFTKLKDKFGTKKLLSVSAVFFLLKIIFTMMATTVYMLYFSMLFQTLSFAIFIPASVTLVNEIMNEKDAVKGQAFVTIAMTVSNLLASIITGMIIEQAGPQTGLLVGVIVTFIGVVIAIFSLFRI